MLKLSRGRRSVFARSAFIALVLSRIAVAQTADSTTQPAAPAVQAVAAVGFTVSDLDREVEFFTMVLDFETVSIAPQAGTEFSRLKGLDEAKARVARLRLGEEVIELTQYDSPRGKPFPDDSRSNDRWFQHIAIIVSDMDKAYARLVEHGVRPASQSGPQRLPDWNKNAAGIRAFYFRDPDGHYLEILQFPEGKGDAKWHRPSDKLFLGIDHTAIVVADTDASLRFYRDTLGFRVVGGSENYGVEQERLNNVVGAHLRITTLRASAGPAIEFLEYLTPRDGRSFPESSKSNDLVYWEVTLIPTTATRAADALRNANATSVSKTPNRDDPGSDGATIVRDPDGHALRITPAPR